MNWTDYIMLAVVGGVALAAFISVVLHTLDIDDLVARIEKLEGTP